VPALGITGGIATGKTTFTAALRRHISAEVFDSDFCARELLANDSEVHEKLRAQFGAEIFDAEKKPDRARLREIVFADEQKRRALEAILHPAIRARWLSLAAHAEKNWLFVDIPLLFETHAAPHFDRIVVVACSDATQRARLTGGRNLTPEIARQILAAQLPLAEKMQKANHVIWNESPLPALEAQARLFAEYLKQRHG
jgi:dephospho-CoA kinase